MLVAPSSGGVPLGTTSRGSASQPRLRTISVFFAPGVLGAQSHQLVRSGDRGGVTCGRRSGWRRRAKDVRGSDGMLSRFAPPGHRRPRVARARPRFAPPGHGRPLTGPARRTSRAAGPGTIVDQARTAYISRHRATNDRCPGAHGVPLAPPGHGRPSTRRARRTSRAAGPQISAGAATSGSVRWDR